MRRVQNRARPKRRAPGCHIFVIPRSSFRLAQPQEALKSLYRFWQKSSRVGGCVYVGSCASKSVYECVFTGGGRRGAVGHRAALQSRSHGAVHVTQTTGCRSTAATAAVVATVAAAAAAATDRRVRTAFIVIVTNSPTKLGGIALFKQRTENKGEIYK